MRSDIRIPREILDSFGKQALDEMEACKELGVPFFTIPISLLGNTPSDELRVQEEITEPFHVEVDVDSLEGYHILLRFPSFISGTRYTPHALDVISRLGGENAVTNEDIGTTDHWYLHISQHAIKRKIGCAKVSELESALPNYIVDGNVFIKHILKDYIGHGTVLSIDEALHIMETGLLVSREKGTYRKVSADTRLILSEPICLQEDEHGTLEYRTWVINSIPVVINRYGRVGMRNVPSEVHDFALEFTESHERLPRHYVVDIGLSPDLGPVVVEVQSIIESGDTNKEMFNELLRAYIS